MNQRLTNTTKNCIIVSLIIGIIASLYSISWGMIIGLLVFIISELLFDHEWFLEALPRTFLLLSAFLGGLVVSILITVWLISNIFASLSNLLSTPLIIVGVTAIGIVITFALFDYVTNSSVLPQRKELVTPQRKELTNYLRKAQGITRTKLNIMCFVAIFVMAPLYGIVFDRLGRRWLGFLYATILVGTTVNVATNIKDPDVAIIIIFVNLIFYVIGWVHANIVFSRLESAAKTRLIEIKRLKSITTDIALEYGIILHKVLQKSRESINVLTKALRMPKGDPLLLNSAGVVMLNSKRYKEACEYFDRAVSITKDKRLIKQINKNHHRAKRQIP